MAKDQTKRTESELTRIADTIAWQKQTIMNILSLELSAIPQIVPMRHTLRITLKRVQESQ